MREIKFRTFIKKEQKMIHNNHNAMAVEMFTPNYAYLNSEVEIMQYTGLKDKNGNEIYEGDILEGTSYLYGYQLKDGKQFYYKGYVEWSSQCDVGLCWLLSDSNGSWELKQTVHRNNIDYSTGIIIGNIYENPELTIQLT